MPLGQYPDFAACVEGIMKKKGFSKQRAKRYCGAIQHAVEKKKELSSKMTELEKRVDELGRN